MTEETREISNEEDQATIEQPVAVEEDTAVAREVAGEPVQQGLELADADEAAPEPTETSAEEMPPEEASPQSPDEARSQAPESVAQVDEASVEILDAAQPEDAAQEPADSDQRIEGTETGVPPASGLQPSASEQSPTIESVIEAILFASDEPLPESKLVGIVETTGKQVRESVESLNARYEAHGNAFRIEQIAGGYQMLTQPIYNSWLTKMVRVRSDNKLSPAAMETLAIIAYKQPIIRADIEAIRGVAVGEVIRSLMYKGLVKIAGRAEILGRPMLYGTTKKFLEVFGLNSIKDLPKAEDLKNPDRG